MIVVDLDDANPTIQIPADEQTSITWEQLTCTVYPKKEPEGNHSIFFHCMSDS